MKITGVRGYPVKVGHRNQFVVMIETDEGITGVGEGGISGRELAMQGMLEHFSGFLIGEDPRRIEHLWQTMYRGAYFEGGKITAATLSAVDIALWDILGKWLGVPVYQLLGGASRERVQCFASPGVLNGPACVERARELAESGWRYLRFVPGMGDEGWTDEHGDLYEPFESIELAVHWLGEIRRALGSSVELSIDFHHRLSVAEAALFCQRVGAAPPPFRGRADPCRERGGISPAAEHDSPAVRDRRRVFQQMGIRSIHRAGTAELRAARRLERRWPDRGEKGRRLVRGALYRRHAAQPAGTSDDGGDDPSGSGHPELRPVGVPAPVGRGVPA